MKRLPATCQVFENLHGLDANRHFGFRCGEPLDRFGQLGEVFGCSGGELLRRPQSVELDSPSIDSPARLRLTGIEHRHEHLDTCRVAVPGKAGRRVVTDFGILVGQEHLERSLRLLAAEHAEGVRRRAADRHVLVAGGRQQARKQFRVGEQGFHADVVGQHGQRFDCRTLDSGLLRIAPGFGGGNQHRQRFGHLEPAQGTT